MTQSEWKLWGRYYELFELMEVAGDDSALIAGYEAEQEKLLEVLTKGAGWKKEVVPAAQVD